MNCDEIDLILDQHETHSMSRARLAAVEAHLAACRRCADHWQIAEALAREDLPPTRAGLFNEIVSGTERMPGPTVAAVRARPSLLYTGLLAASVVVAVSLTLLIGHGQPSNDAPRTADSAPTVTGDAPQQAAREATARTLARDDAEPFLRRIELPDTEYELGVHYARVPGSAGSPPSQRTIQVVQFFMYGCPPCFAFEPRISAWSDANDGYIDLTYVPVAFNAVAALHARAFYAAEALDKADEMHSAFFAEIHDSGNRLDSVDALADFFARFGVDARTFRAAWDSPTVRARLDYAFSLAGAWNVTSTPTLVVADTYLTSPAMAGSYEAALEIVTALAAHAETSAESAADQCESLPRPRVAPAPVAPGSPTLDEDEDLSASALANFLDFVSRGRAREAQPSDDACNPRRRGDAAFF